MEEEGKGKVWGTGRKEWKRKEGRKEGCSSAHELFIREPSLLCFPRFMLGLAAIPSLVMFLGLLFMPESPRWLVYHGKRDKARRVLRKIRAPEEVEPELQSIIKSYVEHTQSKIGRQIQLSTHWVVVVGGAPGFFGDHTHF
jgi:hypothetical protein